MRYPAILTSALLATTVALSGCGTTTQDRGISGAGIGAGAGAIIGAVTGLSVLEGAVLGAVGGGLAGALTKPSQVNMGDPAWKKSQGAANTAAAAPAAVAAAPAAQAQPNLNQAVMNLQSQLAAKGYDPGPIDGVMGERTRAAIRAYQRDRQMPVDGQVTQALVTSLAAN